MQFWALGCVGLDVQLLGGGWVRVEGFGVGGWRVGGNMVHVLGRLQGEGKRLPWGVGNIPTCLDMFESDTNLDFYGYMDIWVCGHQIQNGRLIWLTATYLLQFRISVARNY